MKTYEVRFNGRLVFKGETEKEAELQARLFLRECPHWIGGEHFLPFEISEMVNVSEETGENSKLL